MSKQRRSGDEFQNFLQDAKTQLQNKESQISQLSFAESIKQQKKQGLNTKKIFENTMRDISKEQLLEMITRLVPGIPITDEELDTSLEILRKSTRIQAS